jgi:hypothetical protein
VTLAVDMRVFPRDPVPGVTRAAHAMFAELRSCCVCDPAAAADEPGAGVSRSGAGRDRVKDRISQLAAPAVTVPPRPDGPVAALTLELAFDRDP